MATVNQLISEFERVLGTSPKPVKAKTRIVKRAGKIFRISGGLWNVCVHVDGHCVAFGIATANDAENWIWKTYPETAE